MSRNRRRLPPPRPGHKVVRVCTHSCSGVSVFGPVVITSIRAVAPAGLHCRAGRTLGAVVPKEKELHQRLRLCALCAYQGSGGRLVRIFKYPRDLFEQHVPSCSRFRHSAASLSDRQRVWHICLCQVTLALAVPTVIRLLPPPSPQIVTASELSDAEVDSASACAARDTVPEIAGGRVERLVSQLSMADSFLWTLSIWIRIVVPVSRDRGCVVWKPCRLGAAGHGSVRPATPRPSTERNALGYRSQECYPSGARVYARYDRARG